MALPRFLMLKSNANNKYLCHTTQKLGFTYDEVNDESSEQDENITHSHLRFEVENSKTVDGLVHIRSCYNNKYLARKSIDNNRIAATGHESEEDQSKWSCTLFKPVFLDSNTAEVDATCNTQKIRLLHISESEQRCVGSHVSDHLIAGAVSSVPDLIAINVEASAILPEYVTFMGPNNKYLVAVHVDERFHFLVFSGTEIGASGVAHRVPVPTTQKTSIIDKKSNKYWCQSQLLSCLLDLTDHSSMALLFEAVKVDNNHTALRCIATNMFIICHGESSLAVNSSPNITKATLLRVGEPVLSRAIKDSKYNLADSRIYNNNSLEKYSDSRSNHTDVEQEGSFQVKYTVEKSYKWTNSTTVNIGINVSWSAGIPYVGEVGVGISYDHSQMWESGGEVKTSKEVTYTQGIKIPPGKKVTLKVLAHKASCDVPYTCTAIDLMTDGNKREYTMSGLYTGTNEFLFETDIIQQDL